MQFHLLPPGVRFEYQGIVYRKLNSLTASPEDGGKMRLIPRSAKVKPVTEDRQHSEEQNGTSASPAVQALKALYHHCQTELSALEEGASPAQIDELKRGIEAAYQGLTEGLKEAAKSA